MTKLFENKAVPYLPLEQVTQVAPENWDSSSSPISTRAFKKKKQIVADKPKPRPRQNVEDLSNVRLCPLSTDDTLLLDLSEKSVMGAMPAIQLRLGTPRPATSRQECSELRLRAWFGLSPKLSQDQDQDRAPAHRLVPASVVLNLSGPPLEERDEARGGTGEGDGEGADPPPQDPAPAHSRGTAPPRSRDLPRSRAWDQVLALDRLPYPRGLELKHCCRQAFCSSTPQHPCAGAASSRLRSSTGLLTAPSTPRAETRPGPRDRASAEGWARPGTEPAGKPRAGTARNRPANETRVETGADSGDEATGPSTKSPEQEFFVSRRLRAAACYASHRAATFLHPPHDRPPPHHHNSPPPPTYSSLPIPPPHAGVGAEAQPGGPGEDRPGGPSNESSRVPWSLDLNPGVYPPPP